MQDVRGELEALKTQLATVQQRPPIVFLVQCNIHVSYGAGVVWKEVKGEHAVFITAGSLKNLRGWPLVDGWRNIVHPHTPDI